MQPEIAQKLIQLNEQFYQKFSQDFSDTRQRLQPGVVQVVDALPRTNRVLDLGCGNGNLAAYLAEKGHQGGYVGMDISANLVEIAANQQLPQTQFVAGSLTDPDWEQALPPGPYDDVFCFAVMHHIPSMVLRLALLSKVHGLLAEGGCFVLSTWQFLQSEKLKTRIQPWARAGLNDELVDENDYLLDWRRGGEGLRYVHVYTNAELYDLAEQSGFRVNGMFHSDGQGGNLGLYHVWERI